MIKIQGVYYVLLLAFRDDPWCWCLVFIIIIFYKSRPMQ